MIYGLFCLIRRNGRLVVQVFVADSAIGQFAWFAQRQIQNECALMKADILIPDFGRAPTPTVTAPSITGVSPINGAYGGGTSFDCDVIIDQKVGDRRIGDQR